MKLLIWIGFIALVMAALYKKMSFTRIRIVRQDLSAQFDETGAEIMKRCAHCGVYIPASEAIHYENAVYCCKDHIGKPPQH